MANETIYIRTTPAVTVYAKPQPLANPWPDDAVDFTESAVDPGSYSATVDTATEHEAFINADGTPGNEAATDTSIGAITASGSSSNIGPGAIEQVVQIQSSGNPVDGAEVWVTTDAIGSNTVAGVLYTDASGNVTFMLDAGDYYAWGQRAGVNITNPTAFTVS